MLTQQPLPGGFRVGVVSNAGGMGVLAASMAEGEGLSVPPLSSDGCRTSLRGVAAAGRRGQPGRRRRRRSTPVALQAALRLRARVRRGRRGRGHAGADHAGRPGRSCAWRSRSPRARCGKPVVVVASDAAAPTRRPGAGLTVFRTPLVAVLALARAMRYAAWRRVSADDAPPGRPGRTAAARAWAAERLAGRGGRARVAAGRGGGRAAGAVRRRAGGPARARRPAAAAAAESLGWPVVVKVSDPDVLHKTDRGLVRVGLGVGRRRWRRRWPTSPTSSAWPPASSTSGSSRSSTGSSWR